MPVESNAQVHRRMDGPGHLGLWYIGAQNPEEQNHTRVYSPYGCNSINPGPTTN